MKLTEEGKNWLTSLDLADFAVLRKGWHLSTPATPVKPSSPVSEVTPKKTPPPSDVEASPKPKHHPHDGQGSVDGRLRREALKWRAVCCLAVDSHASWGTFLLLCVTLLVTAW